MTTNHPIAALAPQTAAPPRLEKVAAAALRMSVSVCHVYREVKAGRLRLVKISARASAIPQADVDAWIQARIEGSK